MGARYNINQGDKMSDEGHNQQYTEHRAKSDEIVETLKELVLMNQIMHDGLSEAQTMIGERELQLHVLNWKMETSWLTAYQMGILHL